jgi:hypothetical protein
MYKFKEDDFVEFDVGELKGYGYIRGIAEESVDALGATYIIQWENLRGPKGVPKYEYSCIAVFEYFIRLVEE